MAKEQLKKKSIICIVIAFNSLLGFILLTLSPYYFKIIFNLTSFPIILITSMFLFILFVILFYYGIQFFRQYKGWYDPDSNSKDKSPLKTLMFLLI
jgi:hypothetical protein